MAAMTYLEMVNRVRREAGESGSDLVSLGGTLAASNTRIKSWVNEAWIDIQRLHAQWQFMLSDFSFTTTIGVGTYTAATLSTPITTFKNWKLDTFRAYNTAAGFPDEQLLPYLPFAAFRNMYLFGDMRTTQTRPTFYSVDQSKALRLGPLPDAIYTVNGQYWRLPEGFTADSDTPQTTAPAFTEDYHMLIVWKALESYGLFESATEVLVRAQRESMKVLSRLQIDQLPTMGYGAPLA